MQEWSRQPSNVQWAVFNQNTNIQVVDNLGWQSATLYDTYAPASENKGSLVVNEKTGELEIGDVGADAQVRTRRKIHYRR